ncbi:MAG TPA: NRDE family protein, partial [Nevskia sp.]|nr:NRDE family protein [Nevskia sp.]
LLLWDGEELVVATNRLKPCWETVSPGVHGLSNGAFDQPWPKTTRLSAALSAWLAANDPTAPNLDLAPLYAALADEHRPDDAALPNTGVGIERERVLSTAFIRLPGYGTRASQIVIIGADGRTLFAERRYGEDGGVTGEQRIEFQRG